jgi:hypothetical protein
MKLTTLMAALAVSLTLAQTAHAREHHYRHGVYRSHGAYHVSGRQRFGHRYAAGSEQDRQAGGDLNYQGEWGGQSAEEIFARSATDTYSGRPGGRPRAWCGWEMRQLVGSDPGPEFNLARNWTRWGHAGPAGIGAVVVWAHHVGKIVGQEDGQWIIQSGNDGNRVRARALSIAHAIAVRWG